MNLKALLRYDKAAYYFDAALSKFDVVVWLCANPWIQEQISNRLAGLQIRNHGIHQFVMTSDFQADGWSAKVTHGTLQGQTLSDIYMVQRWITPGSSLGKAWVSRSSEIFFPTRKSPNGIKSYVKRAAPSNS